MSAGFRTIGGGGKTLFLHGGGKGGGNQALFAKKGGFGGKGVLVSSELRFRANGEKQQGEKEGELVGWCLYAKKKEGEASHGEGGELMTQTLPSFCRHWGRGKGGKKLRVSDWGKKKRVALRN